MFGISMSKKNKIVTLIVIDCLFFLLEIGIGYYAHSLALVADAFHMLNDVLSLFVGWWAIHVAQNRASSNEYTYGWARAEIIGGLINGVFLIALCTTITLEAIQRFFEIQEVKEPRLVLGVGTLGLAFNIISLFIFHDVGHGHSHGDDEESGNGHAHSHDEHTHTHGDDLHSTEEEAIAHGNGKTEHHDHDHENGKTDATKKRTSVQFGNTNSSPAPPSRGGKDSSSRKRAHSRSYSTIEDLPIHPASLRHDMRMKARLGEEADSDTEDDTEDDATEEPSEVSPLLQQANTTASDRRRAKRNSGQINHSAHKHNTAKSKSGGHSHSHDDNARGIFLHIVGDALGNVGVMAAALIIWLSPWKYRFYFDPILSLVITLIILKTAIPLVRDTSRPLLQATPDHINVQDIREDIQSLPGVVDAHHIHVWALTRAKLVATLDIQLDFDFTGKHGATKYMELAKAIKSCLRGHGIHSSTVQPEFCVNTNHPHSVTGADAGNGEGSSSSSSRDTVVQDAGQSQAPCEHGECLLSDSRGAGMQCCAPGAGSGTSTPKKDKKKSHDHEHDHEHDFEQGHGHDHDHSHGHEH